MAANSNNVAVVMVPFPEYGHQTPFLHLSRIISSYDIPVHYVSIGARNQELKRRLQGSNLDQFPNIQFHDLSIPSARATTAEKEDDNYMSYFASLELLGEPLCAICHQLLTTCKRVVIIHDSIMLSVVQGVISITNVETYIFHVISAFTVCSLFQQVSGSAENNDLFLPLQHHIPSFQSCYPPEMLEFIKMLRDWTFKSGEIFNTCIDIEGPYLNALAKQSEKPLWDLGPLINPVYLHNDEYSASPKIVSHRCIEWLDKQPKNSVIYVSFGTARTFSLEQIIELALGLERSEQKFIWVLREADKKGNDFTTDVPKIELPIGFEERVAERGIIARDFVPQMEILAHPSTGGYLFHSGWNSFLESLTMGVPMATWPIHSDNPFNDVLITKVLKVGLVVKDWAHKDDLVKADRIENGVRTLITSPEGEEMRQRAIALSQAIKMSVKDGGATKEQTESFIAHITR
ncbi:zeatin O-glucosyltransferase-like [Nicotiana sylvestris]|uniref:Zeatin O-glucosyltransferase-like n=1 Tax=Nicotiana sylvestris TaxID=4096 RepID=A0A1U7WGY5_NICSY|nr:PREDICTED: zeatin O-glucosyltransferase-like [Nicotiana sylvestris]WIW42737.1 UDP-glycosyltransferase [Nicotiana tabacum]